MKNYQCNIKYDTYMVLNKLIKGQLSIIIYPIKGTSTNIRSDVTYTNIYLETCVSGV